jgi:hypothetical protein
VSQVGIRDSDQREESGYPAKINQQLYPTVGQKLDLPASTFAKATVDRRWREAARTIGTSAELSSLSRCASVANLKPHADFPVEDHQIALPAGN